MLGTLLEAPLRVVVWLVIGIPIALLVWSVASASIVAALAVVALQIGVFLAFVGYLPESLSRLCTIKAPEIVLARHVNRRMNCLPVDTAATEATGGRSDG